MNPERLYRQHREDAMARQIEAEKYSTFMAMPFRDAFNYLPRLPQCGPVFLEPSK